MSNTEKALAWCLALSVSANVAIVLILVKYGTSTINTLVHKMPI